MKITKEMYNKAREHFSKVTPEELYKDLVDNYGLKPPESPIRHLSRHRRIHQQDITEADNAVINT